MLKPREEAIALADGITFGQEQVQALTPTHVTGGGCV